jgi:hypothetical protein
MVAFSQEPAAIAVAEKQNPRCAIMDAFVIKLTFGLRPILNPEGRW